MLLLCGINHTSDQTSAFLLLEALITSHTASAMRTAGLWIDKIWLIMLNGLKNIIVAAGRATSLWSYTSAFYWYPTSLRIGDTSFVSVHLMCVYLCVRVCVWNKCVSVACTSQWMNCLSCLMLLDCGLEYVSNYQTILYLFVWKAKNKKRSLSWLMWYFI